MGPYLVFVKIIYFHKLCSQALKQGSHRSGKVMENDFCLEKSWNSDFSTFIMEKKHGILKFVMEFLNFFMEILYTPQNRGAIVNVHTLVRFASRQ